MPAFLRVRTLTDEEATTIQRLAHSRTEAARRVERAQMVWRSSQDWRVPAIAQEVGTHQQTVRHWLKRFTAAGVQGLEDEPRPGRHPTYSPEQVGRSSPRH